MNPLPYAPATSVNVAALAQLFRSTTNSYKFLFFHAILACLDGRPRDAQPAIPLREVIVEMLSNAWYPHTLFRLSFGSQDKIGQVLDRLSSGTPGRGLKFKKDDLSRLRRSMAEGLSNSDYKLLSRWVPYRLLTPFFNTELARRRDPEKNRVLKQLAAGMFQSRKPLYRLDGDNLVLHPAWAAYLREHRSVVGGWASWHWLHYMQARNPNVPNVAGKLFPVVERASLKAQTTYWNLVSKRIGGRCLYSGIPLPSVETLDHYIPWSFVLHDRIWNLVPVTGPVNSSKGDRLAAGEYLEKLIKVQARGLVAAQQVIKRKQWEGVAEEFMVDLGLPASMFQPPLALPKLQAALERGYKATVPTLERLAVNQGFTGGWRWVD